MIDSKLLNKNFKKDLKEFSEKTGNFNQSGEWYACVIKEKEKNYNRRQYKSYRVGHLDFGVFWLNEIDFVGQEYLYQVIHNKFCFYENFVQNKQLKFKGPFEKYYQIVKKGNSQIILPKNKMAVKTLTNTGYFHKYSRRKNSNKIFNYQEPVMSKETENKLENRLELLASERLTTYKRKEIVKNVQEYLSQSKLEKLNESDINEKKQVIKFHNPKKIVEWLKLFTINNTAIKYSTHLWDQNDLFRNYEEFVSLLNEEFVKYKFKEMPKYNSNLYWNKIYPFLFQKKLTQLQKDGNVNFGWGRHEIKIGWQYPDIIAKWSKKHPGKSPLSMELPDYIKPKSLINGTTIKYFEDVVNLFKKEIEFRDIDLFIETKVAVKEIIPNHKINEDDIETLKNCNFYTNTEYVIKAIRRILYMIKRKSASSDVNISGHYDSKNNEYVLEIFHHKSFSDKPVNDPKILLKEDTGDLGIIKTTLMSLCDFSIESRFISEKGKYQFYRIDYLYNDIERNNWQPKITEIDHIEGFKYIFKFPAI